MVLLIFEGPDNLGKSTIINKIVSNFKDTKDICMMHSTGPRTNGEDPFVYQSNSFKEKTLKILVINSSESQLKYENKNIVILDRAWYGEYVYGQIYRNGNSKDIMTMIKSCDKSISKIKHCVINLVASPEFICDKDDNKSLSSQLERDERIEKIKNELKFFDECFKKSKANVINVNVEDNGNYRHIDDIYNDIIYNLKNKFNIVLND